MSVHVNGVKAADPRPEFIGLDYAASFYATSQKTIRRMIADGSLPAYRLGKRQIKIKYADLEKLVRPIPTAR